MAVAVWGLKMCVWLPEGQSLVGNEWLVCFMSASVITRPGWNCARPSQSDHSVHVLPYGMQSLCTSMLN